ncbi:restriction endonuclease subunit S [Halovenus salina]|uniref:Restriction endonuclease subunit S n=1 Tax=Halovenus salina TaxID=1510225 RepID=A0ABD5VUS1_9EURY|nr:restriction endonuclease subunit S [Halovenus salina]
MSEQDSTLDDFTKNENDSVEENTSSTQLREEGFLTLPYDWDISTVRKAAKQDGLVDGDWIESDDMDETGEIQLVQLGHLGEGQFKGEPDRFITEEFAEEENCTILSEGDLLISRMQAPILRSCLLPTFDYDSIMAVDIARLQHTDNWNRHFLKFLFNSRPIWKQGRAWASGTTRKRISRTNMEKIRLPQPTLDEQRKIATVLYTIDEAIQKTEEIESQLQQIQKGLVKKFLSEGIDATETKETNTKLGTIPKHWNVATIEEILADEDNAFTDGARYSLSSEEIHPEGEARAILLEEVGEGEFKDTTPKFATQEKYEEITHRAIYPGEVVVAKMAEPVARACIVPDTYEKYLLGCADVVRIVPNEEVDDRFLMYCMNSHKVWRQAVAHLRGTGRSRINLENIAELKIPKPPLPEQKRIAEILHDYDRRIENEREYRDQLKRLKQGLMQDLLSGEVRTTDADIEVLDEVRQHG